MPLNSNRILITLAALTLASLLGVSGFYWAVNNHIQHYLLAHPFQSVDPGLLFDPIPSAGARAEPAWNASAGFKTEPSASTPTVPAGPHPIETELLLLGTVTGTADSSFAIIKDRSTGVQGLYRLGQVVREGVLSEILWEKVVIVLGDRRFVLSVADDDGAAGEEGRSTIGVSIRDIRDALDDTSKTLAQIDIQAYAENGKKGLRLARVAPNSIFDRAGLRAGDVIRQINNVPITNPQVLTDLFNQMKRLPVSVSFDSLDENAASVLTQFNPSAAGVGIEVSNLVKALKSGQGVEMVFDRAGETVVQNLRMD